MGHELKQTMRKQKKKGITTVSTTRTGKTDFFHDKADDGPRDMEVSLHEEMQIERPSSRAGTENGKRRRIEEPTEQPDLEIISNSVNPPRTRLTARFMGISNHTTPVAQPNNYGRYRWGKLWEDFGDGTCD